MPLLTVNKVVGHFIKDLADRNSLNIDGYDLDQLAMGFQVEKEHGSQSGEDTNVTHDDPVATLKIAMAHLKEKPDYYTRLKKVEESLSKTSKNSEQQLSTHLQNLQKLKFHNANRFRGAEPAIYENDDAVHPITGKKVTLGIELDHRGAPNNIFYFHHHNDKIEHIKSDHLLYKSTIKHLKNKVEESKMGLKNINKDSGHLDYRELGQRGIHSFSKRSSPPKIGDDIDYYDRDGEKKYGKLVGRSSANHKSGHPLSINIKDHGDKKVRKLHTVVEEIENLDEVKIQNSDTIKAAQAAKRTVKLYRYIGPNTKWSNFRGDQDKDLVKGDRVKLIKTQGNIVNIKHNDDFGAETFVHHKHIEPIKESVMKHLAGHKGAYNMKEELRNMITTTLQEKPSDFAAAFAKAIIPKMKEALDSKRQEVAGTLCSSTTTDVDESENYLH